MSTAMSLGFDPQMKSPPPAPVDRIERTVNPVALIGPRSPAWPARILALWLAPNAIGATLMTWMIVILADLRRIRIAALRLRPLQFPARAARFDTTKAIADSNPDGLIVTDRELRILYANEAYRALSGARGGERPASGRAPVHRLAGRLRSRSTGCRRRRKPAGAASEELRLVAAARPARATSPGTAFAFARSRASPETARRSGRSPTRRATTTGTKPSSRIFSTRSTISTTRRRAFSPPSPTARSRI